MEGFVVRCLTCYRALSTVFSNRWATVLITRSGNRWFFIVFFDMKFPWGVHEFAVSRRGSVEMAKTNVFQLIPKRYVLMEFVSGVFIFHGSEITIFDARVEFHVCFSSFITINFFFFLEGFSVSKLTPFFFLFDFTSWFVVHRNVFIILTKSKISCQYYILGLLWLYYIRLFNLLYVVNESEKGLHGMFIEYR